MGVIEVKNARIESARIVIERGSFLSVWLTLDYGGSGQGFGGYVLYNTNTSSPKRSDAFNFAGIFISEVMGIAEVESWDDLVGKTIRVKCEHSKVHEIGHILKDVWFNPEERFKGLK